ncbi:hypothetical protein OC845_002106 [Tilletia horrida]|nr:hypothetical protein OC845_002106 [Tilletia horrida]
MRSSVSASPAPAPASAPAGRRSTSASVGPSHATPAAAASSNSPAFSQRNLYYLRSSPYTVLQMILYLDARHIAWMNAPSEETGGLRSNGEVVLQKAMAVLRTRIMAKLRRESGSGGRMGVVSRKERVDVYASYDFQMAYFFRKMNDRHAVLLKDKHLVFPNSTNALPLSVDPEAGNAPIPPPPERAYKRRRTDDEGSENLLLNSSDGAADRAEVPVAVKPESTDDQDDLLRSTTGQTIFADPAQSEGYMNTDEELVDEEAANKPQLKVKYSGFRIFGKMLVVVIEPSKSVIANNPDLFGTAQPTEVRQLSVTPSPGGREGSRARTQSRMTSVIPPSAGSARGSVARGAREGSRRDSRAPSPGIGATLFLDTPTPEPESRRFGSRGVSRAMSATPGPSPRKGPRDRSQSPEARTNDLHAAINQRSNRNVRNLPPVPLFDNDSQDTNTEVVQAEHPGRTRQSQAPSPTPEPVHADDSSASMLGRSRGSSIMPRRVSRPPEDGAHGQDPGQMETDVGMAFDFGADDEGRVTPFGEEGDDEDEDEPATGFALATQMMEAVDHAGVRNTDADQQAD